MTEMNKILFNLMASFLVLNFVFDNLFVNGEYNCQYKKDGFYTDLEFCHVYWRCNYGVPEEYECPAGTAWNHLELRCDWLDMVDCTRGGTVTQKPEETEAPETTEEPEAEDSETEEAETEEPDTTTLKTTKKNEKTKIQTTSETTSDDKNAVSQETTGQKIDVKDTSATSAIPTASSTVVQQASNNATSSLCQSIGTYHLPDNTNCASYFMCNMGKETHITCPDRQLFNVETAQCEDFQMVFCGSRPVNHADKNQCASKRDGIYPDIERACRIFYQCVSQQKVREATCPSNLKFNSLTGRCDNPANVMAPCGTYNVTLGSGSSTSSASINKFISWSKYLATLLVTKLTFSRLL